jgi:hypothetical protein
VAVDIKKLFDEVLPAALKANPTQARATLDASFALTVSDVGAWIVVARRGSMPIYCKKLEKIAETDVSVTMREEHLQQLLASAVKPYTAMQLFLSGRMTVEGPHATAMRLGSLLGLPGIAEALKGK